MILALAASLNSNVDILRTFASLLARHILYFNLNFNKETTNHRTNNRFKESKFLNNKVPIQNNINHIIKSSPVITIENKINEDIPHDNSENGENNQVIINNKNEKDNQVNINNVDTKDNQVDTKDNQVESNNDNINDNNSYSSPLSHSKDKEQFLKFCSQVENRIKSSTQIAEANQKIGKRKRNENKKDDKFVNLDENKSDEQNNLNIYDSDTNKNKESDDKKQNKIRHKPKELINKNIKLDDIILNTPIDLEDFKKPFDGVE